MSIVVTGIGLVLPQTHTLEQLWERQAALQPELQRVSAHLEGTLVDDDELRASLPGRLARKLDRFSVYALVATERAIADAALDLDRIARDRCGVFVGNAFGGWRFTELELRHLHLEGPRMVSPFQATSWFPTAPQGQISIVHGLKGHSKTYVADRASSLISVASAAARLESGELDVAIAGGTESINTDFIKAALAPLASHGDDPPWPSWPGRYGFWVSEGAVFLILETHEGARRRGARIYAEIGGFATRNDPCPPNRYPSDPVAMQLVMRAALGDSEPDVVLPDACGQPEIDRAEQLALREVCPQARVRIPKMSYGHSFGAEGALDIAFAALMLASSKPPPRCVLINSRSLGGGLSSLTLTRASKQ
jgi:3-oxoacyl-[acyl-carrier-protein] synthase II